MSLHQCGAGISFPKKSLARRLKYMDPYWRLSKNQNNQYWPRNWSSQIYQRTSQRTYPDPPILCHFCKNKLFILWKLSKAWNQHGFKEYNQWLIHQCGAAYPLWQVEPPVPDSFSKNHTQTRSDFQNQNWNQNLILKKNCNLKWVLNSIYVWNQNQNRNTSLWKKGD
jgi:hypothetical protein